MDNRTSRCFYISRSVFFQSKKYGLNFYIFEIILPQCQQLSMNYRHCEKKSIGLGSLQKIMIPVF